MKLWHLQTPAIFERRNPPPPTPRVISHFIYRLLTQFKIEPSDACEWLWNLCQYVCKCYHFFYASRPKMCTLNNMLKLKAMTLWPLPNSLTIFSVSIFFLYFLFCCKAAMFLLQTRKYGFLKFVCAEHSRCCCRTKTATKVVLLCFSCPRYPLVWSSVFAKVTLHKGDGSSRKNAERRRSQSEKKLLFKPPVHNCFLPLLAYYYCSLLCHYSCSVNLCWLI